jgi:hypothetical protein
LTTVRLTYRAMEDGVWPEVWSSEEVVVDVGRLHALVSGLQDRTTYQIKMEVGNSVGELDVQNLSVGLTARLLTLSSSRKGSSSSSGWPASQ